VALAEKKRGAVGSGVVPLLVKVASWWRVTTSKDHDDDDLALLGLVAVMFTRSKR
jgi:hypothetical protein